MIKDCLYFRQVWDGFVRIVYLGSVIGSFKYDRYNDRWKLDLEDAYWLDSQAISYAFEDYLAANA